VIGPDNLSRVAVSLDTLDEKVQDGLRGRGAWRDAMDTIRLLGQQGDLFYAVAEAPRHYARESVEAHPRTRGEKLGRQETISTAAIALGRDVYVH
jgi:hypothetical protein